MSNLLLGSGNLNQPSPTSQAIALLGQEQFNQAARPTVRRDGSALVAGDRWYDTTDGLWWRWDGTYWKSDLITFSVDGPVLSASSSIGLLAINDYDLWLRNLTVITGFTSGTHTGSDYWDVKLRAFNQGRSSFDQSSVLNTLGCSNTNASFLTFPLNSHVDLSALGLNYFDVALSKNASAPNTRFTVTFSYQLVKP